MKENNRLYVIVDTSLSPVYGCVQGGHAVANWLLEHPKQTWNNQYLIYVYGNVKGWIKKLERTGHDFSVFCEPDLKNQSTAIAILNRGTMFKKLKLVH